MLNEHNVNKCKILWEANNKNRKDIQFGTSTVKAMGYLAIKDGLITRMYIIEGLDEH